MNRLYLAVVLLYISACQPKYLTPDELNEFISDEGNGLKKSISIENTTVEISYRPTDLLVLQEAGDGSMDTLSLKTLHHKYDNHYYFILSLSTNGKEALHQTGTTQYSDLVQTLSFRMRNYVTLTTSVQDTIPVGDFILNRTYGISAATSLLFAFDKEKAKDKTWIQFNLNEFGLGIGNQRFRFKTKDLIEVPRLKFYRKEDV